MNFRKYLTACTSQINFSDRKTALMDKICGYRVQLMFKEDC